MGVGGGYDGYPHYKDGGVPLSTRSFQVCRRGREVKGRMEVDGGVEDEMGLNGKSAFAALPLRSPTSLSIYLDTEERGRDREKSQSHFPFPNGPVNASS